MGKRRHRAVPVGVLSRGVEKSRANDVGSAFWLRRLDVACNKLKRGVTSAAFQPVFIKHSRLFFRLSVNFLD